MSARITPRPRAADTHAGALDAALEGKAHLVYRIVLEAKRAPDGWRLFQDLAVDNDPEDPLGPDEIRDEVLSYIRDDSSNGPAKYRATFFGRKEDGSETRLALVEAGFEPTATSDQRATAETNAVVDVVHQLRLEKAEQHKHYIELLKIAMTVPATFAETVKANVEVLGKSDKHYEMLIKELGYRYMDRDEERQSRERIETDKTRFGALEKAAAKLEPLAMAWLFKIMKDSGFDPSTIDPTLFGTGTPGAAPSSGGAPTTATVIQLSAKIETLRKFCRSLTNDEKVKLIDACDDEGDALSLLFGASNAPDDQSCDACLKEMRDRLKAKGRDIRWVVRTLSPIVGDRAAPLLPILRPIWEEK